MKGEYSQSVSVLDSIQLFFGYVLFHALPPILVAALAGALVGLFLAMHVWRLTDSAEIES